MWRYLSRAFWARPELPGVGRIPWNAVALAGFGILGFGHEAFWFLGAALEAAYLAALVSNARFRAVIDAADRAPEIEDADNRRKAALDGLSESRRDRHAALLREIEDTLRRYRKSDVGDVLAETNRAALEQLAELHMRLLAAQQGLDDLHAATDESALRREIDLVKKELGYEKITAALRESKKATLAILEKRLANLTRREESLAEIEGDLDRIEAQVSLARENAAMSDQPEAVSANIELASHLLDDTTWSSAPGQMQ
jgi:hypothetical protein